MRTRDSVTPSLTGGDVALSLAGYMAAYLIMFPAGVWLMARVVRQGIEAADIQSPVAGGRPQAPVQALPAASDAPMAERRDVGGSAS